jgi:hypothetical protein|tara:strand:+ start:5312 stop:5596 length:285 start_codon:yes stop_codon:yes gene_type:complete
METVRGTGKYLVFGWPSDEPSGGMRDFLGVVEDLQSPWMLARITDVAEIMENGDWEWTVDFVEVVSFETLKPVGAWWVNPDGTWREFDGKYDQL